MPSNASCQRAPRKLKFSFTVSRKPVFTNFQEWPPSARCYRRLYQSSKVPLVNLSCLNKHDGVGSDAHEEQGEHDKLDEYWKCQHETPKLIGDVVLVGCEVLVCFWQFWIVIMFWKAKAEDER